LAPIAEVLGKVVALETRGAVPEVIRFGVYQLV